MRRVADRAMGFLARSLIRIFFRRVTIEWCERVPVDSPTVLVANHVNGLIDGLLLMATLPRYPRFLGKSTLFNIVPLRPFLRLAGVVPVNRAKDGEAGIRNDSALATCRTLLASGGMVAVFPEGISHDESMLQPLRTGAARIAWARRWTIGRLAWSPAALLCGYPTIGLVERLQRMGGLLEGYRVVKRNRNLIPSMLAARLRVSDMVHTVIADGQRNPRLFRSIT